MKGSTRKTFAILFAVIMAMSMVSMGAAALGTSSGGELIYDQGIENVSDVDINVDEDAFSGDDARVNVLVDLERADNSHVAGDRDAVIENLKAHADATQADLLALADERSGIEVRNTFFLGNSVALTISDEAHLDEIAATSHVKSITNPGTFSIPEVEMGEASPDDDDVTYGLEMHNVPEVHDMGITGDGATVAVTDTGIDPDHPDWEDRVSEDNFVEIDSDGNPTDAPPNDGHGHGTHVAGTIAGPANPDDPDQPQYGVAPDADMYHINALPGGSATTEQVLGSLEYALDETDADVVAASWGGDINDDTLIDVTVDMMEANVLLSASNGNNFPGRPAHYYDPFASQAIDENQDPASFAVPGQEVDPDALWGDSVPDHWPETYYRPDASAAGVNVLSSHSTSGTMCAGAEYCEVSGTSMSQPHKAGTFALMVSGAGQMDHDFFQDVMEDTAEDIGDDPIFGAGSIDALAAVQFVAHDQEIEGTVSAADGSAFEGADVTVDDTGIGSTTDADGFYTIIHEAGTFDVTADGFGHQSATEQVELEENETAVQDFDLDAELDAMLVADQPSIIEAGDEVSAVLKPAHADTITVEEVADYDGDMTLTVDGEDADFGDAVDLDLDDWYGEVEVVVETENDVAGDVELEHTFEGEGDELSITTGPTEVVDELIQLAVIDDTEGYGDDWVSTLDDHLPDVYEIEHVDSGDALEDLDAYDAYFVHGLAADNVDDWFDETDDVPTVYTSQFLGPDTLGDRSDAIGDPDEVTTASSLATWTVEEDHDIFDGVAEPGDDITVHGDSFADGASFDGTDADVIASQEDGSHGIAVDYDRDDVMLTAVGFGWVSPGDHTDDGLDVLANSLDYFIEEDEAPPAPPEPGEATVGVVDEGSYGAEDYERADGDLGPLDEGEDLIERLEDVLPEEYEIDGLSSAEAVEAAEDGDYAVYVVNEMDQDLVEEFDDLTAGDAAGVVWLDQWGGTANGISDKSDVLENPASTGQAIADHPDLSILEDHAIFDGVGDVGDLVQLTADGNSDHTWFDDYDGDVIGEIESGGEVDGDGVGIDEEKRTILLASLGSSMWVSGDDFTEEAETLLGNSVEYLADVEEDHETVMAIEDETVAPNFPDGSTTVYAESDEAIAGFQSFIEFDPADVSIESVEPVDFEEVVYELDNDEGWLRIAAAEAEGLDDPVLAEVGFSTSMAPGAETELTLQDDSALNDEMGSKLDTELKHGTIDKLDYDLGDVLNDGEVHSGDAVVVQAYLAGLDLPVPTEQVETYGDVTQTGEVTSADVTAILQLVIDVEIGDEPPGLDGAEIAVLGDTAVEVDGEPIDPGDYDPEELAELEAAGELDIAPEERVIDMAAMIEENSNYDITVTPELDEDMLDLVDEYDHFVINDFGSFGFGDDPPIEEFEDALGDDQAVVYLENQGPMSDAVDELLATRPDVDYDSAGDGDGPTEFEIVEDHPVFDGVGEVGERVPMYHAIGTTGSLGHRTWFEGYEPTTLANIGLEGEEVEGPSFAIDEENGEALIGIGWTSFTASEPGEIYEEADILLVNTLEYTAMAVADADGEQTESIDASGPVAPSPGAIGIVG